MKEIKLLEDKPGTVLVNEDGRIYCVCINKSYSKNEAEKLMKKFIQEHNVEYRKDLLNNAKVQKDDFEFQELDKIEIGKLNIQIDDEFEYEEYEGEFIYQLDGDSCIFTEEMWIGHIK